MEYLWGETDWIRHSLQAVMHLKVSEKRWVIDGNDNRTWRRRGDEVSMTNTVIQSLSAAPNPISHPIRGHMEEARICEVHSVTRKSIGFSIEWNQLLRFFVVGIKCCIGVSDFVGERNLNRVERIRIDEISRPKFIMFLIEFERIETSAVVYIEIV